MCAVILSLDWIVASPDSEPRCSLLHYLQDLGNEQQGQTGHQSPSYSRTLLAVHAVSLFVRSFSILLTTTSSICDSVYIMPLIFDTTQLSSRLMKVFNGSKLWSTFCLVYNTSLCVQRIVDGRLFGTKGEEWYELLAPLSSYTRTQSSNKSKRLHPRTRRA